MCLVDDAQWLDRASAQALAFVARRLLAESVALVFAVREPSEETHWSGLPELVGRGARATATRARCSTPRVPGRLDERVRDRIIAETRGNPLALLELPAGLTPAELAGGFGLPDARPLAEPHRAELPAAARVAAARRRSTLLLVAAAEPVGDVDAAVAGGRATRDRSRRGGAGRGRRADRVRDAGAVPPSAGALGGVPGGDGAGPPRRRIARWPRRPIPEIDPDRRAWHRANAAPRARRGGGGRAGALGRPGAGPRRRRGGGRVPGAGDRADPGPRPAGSARAGRGAGEVRRRRARRRRRRCSPRPSCARSTSSSGRGWSGCAPRSRSPAGAAATRRRCCSRPRSRLEPLDAGAGPRDVPRGARRRRSSPAASAGGPGWSEVAEAARAAPPRRRRRGPIDLLLDGLALPVHRGLRRGASTPAAGAAGSCRARTDERIRWLLAGVPHRRRSCGTTRRGTSWPPARSAIARERRRARRPSHRARSTARACTCTPASSPPRRR